MGNSGNQRGSIGRTDGKARLCLAEPVTPKGKEGLKKAFVDGKPMQIFGSNQTDRQMIGLKKFSEGRVQIKLVSVADNIRFRRFSTTNEIHSCDFDRGRIWGRKGFERCNVPELKNGQLAIAFHKTRKFVYAHAQKPATVCAVSQVRLSIGDVSVSVRVRVRVSVKSKCEFFL